MLKRMIAIVFTVFLCSSLYAAKFEKHTLGFGVEGGISRSFLSAQNNSGKAYFDLYGTFGGAFFYQYRLNEVVAFRPEIALYSYFFGVPGPMDDLKGDVFASLHGRVGFTLALYAYTSRKFSLPFLLTPLFVSMRFYDSAGTYETYFDGEQEVIHDYGVFVGGQVAFGIERSHPKKTGVGLYFFMRMSDSMLGTAGHSGIPCSMGGNFTFFW